MTAEALSQEEIDALLSGFSGGSEGEDEGAGINPEEREVLEQYQAAVAKGLAGTLTGLTSSQADVKPGDLQEATPDNVGGMVAPPLLATVVTYTKGLAGKTILLFPQDNAVAIVSAMMGGVELTELGEDEASALSEAASQTFGAAHTTLGGALGLEIATEPPELASLDDAGALTQSAGTLGSRFVVLPYTMKTGDITGAVYQLASNDLIGSLMSAKVTPEPAATTTTTTVQEAPGGEAAGAGGSQVAQVQFAELESTPQASPKSLDLILDIGLTVKVELGRTRRQVRDVLSLTQGAVVELNKLVGEPLDIIVNDQLFARGEVVVIDENFGVRVTEILSQQERIEALKSKRG